jgi:surface protein
VGKTSSGVGVCQLVDKAAGSLAEGEMMMTCTPFGGSPERVKAMAQNKVKTFAGNRYTYAKNKRAEKSGECDLSSYNGRPFVTTWRTTSSPETIALPLFESNSGGAFLRPSKEFASQYYGNQTNSGVGETFYPEYNFLVDWGDGSSDMITSWNQAEVSHEYATAGDYDVSIYGRMDAWDTFQGSDGNFPYQANIIDVKQWGDINFKSTFFFFRGTNLGISTAGTITATDVPNLRKVKSMYGMFRGCGEIINLDLSGWDVRNVELFDTFAISCGKLQSISFDGWDTTSMKSMSYFLGYGPQLISPPDMSHFNTGNCIIFDVLMWDQTPTLFDFNISKWDTNNAITFGYMFSGTSANLLGIGNLSTRNVRIMSSGFAYMDVTDSIDLSSWDVSNVRNFDGFMENSQFSSVNVSGWDVRKAKDMSEMFQRMVNLTSLDLSSFRTTSATDMLEMFQGCTALTDLDISNFYFSKVTDLRGFFHSSPNIDMSQIDIASWDISSVTLASNFMFNGPTMTTAQYDALLIAWSQLPVQPNVTWHFGAAQYTSGGAAEAARDVLTGAPNNWIITDGGAAP